MRDQLKKRIIYALFAALVMIFIPGIHARAEENFTSDYSQHTFDEDEGFDSGEANCICQSPVVTSG